MQGIAPDAALGAAAKALYAGLGEALHHAGVDGEVAAATVFTAGDAVEETFNVWSAVKAKYTVTIDGLALDAAPNAQACVFKGHVSYPQFQKGTPPFDSDGLFVLGDDGAPVKQRDETAPVAIVIPKSPMPAAGYPLALYFHGSGGFSADVIDKGPTLVAGGGPQAGTGPGHAR